MPIKQVAINVLEKIEDAYKNRGTVTGIPSGFIDRITNCPVSSLQILF